MAKPKIRIADIESARRALEQAPEHHAEEVTKREAIQSLLEGIRAAQKKGYTLEDVANLLTNNGIAVSKVLLKSYLSHAPARSGKRKKRPREHSMDSLPIPNSLPVGTPRGRPEAVAPTHEEPIQETASSASTDTERLASETGAAKERATASTDARAIPERSKAPAAANPGNKRPSDFRPRKDSDDI